MSKRKRHSRNSRSKKLVKAGVVKGKCPICHGGDRISRYDEKGRYPKN